MKKLTIKEILPNDFEQYSKKHILRNMFQSVEYAKLMSKYDYNPLFIGAYSNNQLVAASLILTKNIAPAFKYGYAPRGFLVDFLETDLVNEFSKELQNFLFKRNIVFVKINPEITYAIVDSKTGQKQINYTNAKIIDVLESIGYIKLKDNKYFEALLPKFNAVIDLKQYNENKLNDDIQQNIKDLNDQGLTLRVGNDDDIEKFYDFIKEKKNRPVEYYKDYYRCFNESNMMDLLFVDVDNNKRLLSVKEEYEKEQSINSELNYKFQQHPSDTKILTEKMLSDKRLSDLNVSVGEVSTKIRNNIQNETIATALVIKYINRIYIVINGIDKNYSRIKPKYFLISEMIKKYKKEGFRFLDMNGITGDFSLDNPYKELNDFKFSFKPTAYEYLGEFDMVINKTMYQLLLSSNKIQKEFQKTDILPINKEN